MSTFSGPTCIQHTSHEAFIWSLLHHRNSRHENIHPLLGIVTTFDNTVSIVAEYVARGDAHDCVQDPRVDTASLVRRRTYLPCICTPPTFHPASWDRACVTLSPFLSVGSHIPWRRQRRRSSRAPEHTPLMEPLLHVEKRTRYE